MMKSQIQEYNATTAALATLKERLKDVRYDVATTAGMDAAKRDRRELVTLRTSLEAKRKEIKEPALKQCQLIDSEAKRITAELLALETPIDQQIKAEEAKKEEERAEKARIAAAAQKVLDDKILEIGKLPLRCIGKTSEEITLFLATLEAKEIGGEFTGETRERAEAAKAEAVAEIRRMQSEAIAAEEQAAILKAEQEKEAARLEEERIEHERLAAIEREAMEKRQAELAEQQRIQEAEQEKLRKEREAFEAEQAESRRIKEAEEAERNRIAAEEKAAAEKKAEQERQEREREAREKAAAAEQERLRAEKERKAAERARKVAEAKCKDAATAFRKILDICQNSEVSDTRAREDIALIAEGNL